MKKNENKREREERLKLKTKNRREYEKKKKSGWWDMDLKPRYQLMYYDENDVFKS